MRVFPFARELDPVMHVRAHGERVPVRHLAEEVADLVWCRRRELAVHRAERGIHVLLDGVDLLTLQKLHVFSDRSVELTVVLLGGADALELGQMTVPVLLQAE